jgi:CSLREA domain-containing protein
LILIRSKKFYVHQWQILEELRSMLNKSCFLFISLFIFLSAIGVNAATYTVSKIADTNDGVCDADCSLREAIAIANSTPSDDIIDFRVDYFANSQKRLELVGPLFVITNNGALTINGDGAWLYRWEVGGAYFSVDSGASLTLKRFGVYNGAPTAIRNQGTLNIDSSYIWANWNSAIRNDGGNLTITDTTISNNFGLEGAGIYNNSGTTNLVNTTVYRNQLLRDSFLPLQRGAGIFNNTGAILNLTNSTVAGNYGFGGPPIPIVFIGNGIYNNGGTVNIKNSLIGNDIFGTFNSLGFNLLYTNANVTITGDTTGNILNQDAKTAQFGYYGGFAPTLALRAASPAINAGNTATSPITDQRGAPRVGTADIGAFELNSSQNGGNYVAILPTAMPGFSYNFSFRFTDYLLTRGTLPNGILLKTGSTASDGITTTLDGIPTIGGAFNFSLSTPNGETSANITDYRLNVLVPTSVVRVGGRVLTSTGRGLPNAVVTMANQYGGLRFARTNPFGYYNFFDVPSNETFNFSVNSKKNYQYVSRNVTVNGNLSDINLTPQ